jgi:transposase
MKAITIYLGLDVHEDSITIAIAEFGSKGEIRLFGTITNDLHALERAAGPHPQGPSRLCSGRAS